MLEVNELTTRYGALTALHGVSVRVDRGELVALVGPNGAGKTTLMASIVGLLRPSSGSVTLDGTDVTRSDPATLVRRGVALVPERRRIFKDLTVSDNLRLAGTTVPRADRERRLGELRSLFSVLQDKWDVSAGFLSGGQAQQLAVARALMSDPKLLLLDEPCLGLAPTMVDAIFALLEQLRAQGRTILVVEQQARRALSIADRGYVLRTGTIVATGTGAALAADTELFESYVGGRTGTADANATARVATTETEG
jgi:branched-chain amino acid transport system ATP-binding protein